MSRSPADLANEVATKPYAFPGGYPLFALTDDGGCLCKVCCKNEAPAFEESTPGDGWHIIAVDVNWEDGAMICDHCGERIESAYAEEENSDG